MMDTVQHKLEPAFDFLVSESSYLLHQCQAEVCIGGNKYIGIGDVRLDLSPRAGIHIHGEFQEVPINDFIFTDPRTVTSFYINGRQVEGFCLTIGGGATDSSMCVKWCPNSEPIKGIGAESTQITRIVFHLFNFVDFIGTRRSKEQSGTSMHAIEHIDLICDEWRVELKSLLTTRDNINALQAEGGYRLTHVGGIERVDGTSFTGKDADECLQALRIFFSFAKGGWCAPACAVGLDTDGDRVWESWSSPSETWHAPTSWFDPHNGSQLPTLFSGFMKRWNNSEWHEALREVVYWYLNANNSSRGIDAGIILTQAALERLSYEYSVKDRRLLTGKGFKDLRASDKFRLLFSSLGIALEIPNEAHDLVKLSKQSNWLDVPHALTEIRNSLVHPEHQKRGQFSSTYFEAWNLGQWCLEMCVLAICGYSGTYGNRLKLKVRCVGQVEDVPWAKSNG